MPMAEEFDNVDFLGSAGNDAGQDAAGLPKVVQPKPQALPNRQGPSAILVSTRQKGNPILNNVKSMPWEYSDIPCDYVLGATTCALFLSLKYHRIHPEYIYSRIRALGKNYNLRILLTMVDIDNHEQSLQELSKTSMINNFTLILCWSAQEAGRYIELFKSYEHASPSSIRARQATSWSESVQEFVTTPRQINKTDAMSLVSNFGSLRAAINAQPEELALIPGWGEKKVKSWYTAVREPFRVKRTAKSTASLLRTETTAGSTDAEGTPEAGTPSLRTIPIGMTPSTMSRESTRPEIIGNPRPENGQKRSRLEEIDPDDMLDDDEAILAAEEMAATSKQASARDANGTNAAPAREHQQLSAGVAAALAKYRAND